MREQEQYYDVGQVQEVEQPQYPVQQYPTQDPNMFGVGSSLGYIAQQSADLVKWELDLQEISEKIIHFLRGEFYDLKRGEWIKKGKEMISQEGAEALITRLYPFLHKGIILSNFNEGEVRKNMFRVHIEIINFLYLEGQNFEINVSDYDAIENVVVFNVQAAYNRALGGLWTQVLTTTQRRVEQQVLTNQQGQGKRGGMFSNFFNYFNKGQQ